MPAPLSAQATASLDPLAHTALHGGQVIPAHPLALDERRRLDERRQRALTRYYLDAGAGGVAVAVHTTQFAVHRPEVGLLQPVLELAAEEIEAHPRDGILRIVGVVGPTAQAVAEAELARSLGYQIALVSPGGLEHYTDDQLLERCAAIGEVLPVFGFYLQPAVGGRPLDSSWWRRLADQPSTVGVKAAPFNRYRTLELVRGIVESDRGEEVALYTGNDDTIVADLLLPFDIHTSHGVVRRRMVGGLLGHWAVWTRFAVELLELAKRAADGDETARCAALRHNAWITEANAAVFDVAHDFHGVIAGVHEVLRHQGLLAGTWCLDPQEELSAGQAQAIGAVIARVPELQAEDAFVRNNLPRWLGGAE